VLEVIEVAKKTPKRVKHIPLRTCVGCREVNAKRALVRIVRTAEGPRVDLTGKASGRGAYLHAQKSCWERALKGALANALKIELTEQDREYLRGYMATLPEDDAPVLSEDVSGVERNPVDPS